jgi:hypothetical protein
MSLFAMTGDQIAAFARDGVMRLPGLLPERCG